MWLGYEEDSPTNKPRGFKGVLPFYKRCDSTVHRLVFFCALPAPACAEKHARVRVRARARHTRTRVHRRASLLDINAQGDTTGKKWRFFRKTLDKTFFLCYTMATKKKMR